MTTSGIYEIRNKKTGHCYIGSSVNMPARKWKHFSHLRNGIHHSRYLQRAFTKWGEDAFEFIVIEEVSDKSMLVLREQYWIETRHPQYNMNPLAASNLGIEVSEETRAKLREYNLRPEVVAKKKAELAGHPVAPETIEKIKVARAKQETTEGMLRGLEIGWNLPPEKRVTRQGQANSDEQNRKIAEAHRGMKHSPESIEKMRAAKLGDTSKTAKRPSTWASKSKEEKARIVEKHRAYRIAKRTAKTIA